MCGICVLMFRKESCEVVDGGLFSFLDRRGPDAQTGHKIQVSPKLDGYFYGSTLHFRGKITPQPLQDSCGNVLLWNGEIFGGIQVSQVENDGQVLLSHLGISQEKVNILESFSNIQGPWAAVYWQAATKRMWFGRDVFGRRSLLCQGAMDSGVFALSSVKLNDLGPWQEVPALGMYCLQYSDNLDTLVPLQVTMYPWAHCTQESTSKVLDKNGCSWFNETLRDKSDWISSTIDIGDYGIKCPFNKFNTDLSGIPDSPILPFGANKLGINSEKDSSIIQEGPMEPTNTHYDLKDRDCTAKSEMTTGNRKKNKTSPQDGNKTDLNNVDELLKHATRQKVELADKLIEIIGDAVCTRVQCQSHKCSACQLAAKKSGEPLSTLPCETENDSVEQPYCGHSRVAVLFSGGIDSLVITALADRYVPQEEPIDLLNVAFEQQPKRLPATAKKKGKLHDSGESFDPYKVPDRETGLAGLKQLSKLNPNRQWNFVKIDVPILELQENRAGHVRNLVYPLNTVLDDSIGCAVWFAARGQGMVLTGSLPTLASEDWIPYSTTARVVLVGMGADEQLAGYSRHRTKFRESGIEGLVDEIKMEIERISSRNLGRDDRIISDHGRESRFPFLDERVVSFLNSLPVTMKADLTLPRGIGEKYLLRLGAVRLGLDTMALLPKRAIQFGSRVAKAENKKENASDICDRLLD